MIAKEKFLNNSLSYLYKQIRKIYLNSNIYNRKISRVFDGGLNYVPNLNASLHQIGAILIFLTMIKVIHALNIKT